MKTTVSVIVLQPFEWKGQPYMAGQSIVLSPLDAVVLAKKHKVTLTKRKAVAPPVQPPPPPPAPEHTREPDPEPSPEPVKPRRTYRRRDLQAEDATEFQPEQTETDPAA